MKTILLTASFLVFLFPTLAYSQSYYSQSAKGIPDEHIKPEQAPRPSEIDSLSILLNYYVADTSFYTGGQYKRLQGQLINSYYSFPTDTANSYKGKTMFYQNYDCINSIAVAFDSIFNVNANMGFPSNEITSLAIDTIFVPLIQVNHSGHNDTLMIQLATVDASGYPAPSYLLDTTIIDSANHFNNIGNGNDNTIKVIKWPLRNYLILGASKFAVKAIYYDATKQDSCWFIYGYGFFHSNCSYEPNVPTFANPTHFSKLSTPKPLTANSFVTWSEYNAYGFFPTEDGNNVFFPCTSADTAHYHEGTDGANYLQNIDISANVQVVVNTGISTIPSPLTNVNQNYPNPFNSKSTITYSTTQTSGVSLKITDLTGRELISQNYSDLPPGEHSIILNAALLSPGIYFYSISSSGSTVTKKMMVY